MIHFPEVLPDEFLPGYAGRVARSNAINLRELWRQLSSRANALSPTPAVKSRTQILATVLQVEADSLAREHTALPIIRVLRRPHTGLRHADPDDARTLRLCEFNLPARAPYLCSRCVIEDLAYWGLSYWRRTHQIRGILNCPKHGIALKLAHRAGCLDTFPEEGSAATTQHPPVERQIQERYAQVVAGLLELQQALPADQALYRLHLSCQAACEGSWHHNRKRAPLWNHIRSTLRNSGLDAVFPALGHPEEPRYAQGGERPGESWTVYGTGYAFALALTALYACADDALSDVLRPLSPLEQHSAVMAFPTGQLAYMHA